MKTVENLLEAALKELHLIDSEDEKATERTSSRMIFPIYRDGKRRVSEQEAKQLVIKHLEEERDQHEYYYSVETPTQSVYNFTGETGRSGNTDVCLYIKNGDGSYERVHIIEFKAQNAGNFQQDFLKLKNENEKSNNYFVHAIETFDKGTIESLIEKYADAFKLFEDSENSLTICLCILSFKSKYQNSSNKSILFLTQKNWKEQLESLLK
jgi:hypothetical protein